MSTLMLVGAFAVAGIVAPSRIAEPMDIPTFMALPRPEPTAEIRYGEAATQAIDLFLPDGRGPSRSWC